jgi:hypothetical protein
LTESKKKKRIETYEDLVKQLGAPIIVAILIDEKDGFSDKYLNSLTPSEWLKIHRFDQYLDRVGKKKKSDKVRQFVLSRFFEALQINNLEAFKDLEKWIDIYANPSIFINIKEEVSRQLIKIKHLDINKEMLLP